jgi:primosomal replication protein N
VNHLTLHAELIQTRPLRHTPAGIAVFDMWLRHTSQRQQQGHDRSVQLELRAQAFGPDAQELARQPLGTMFEFQGFLNNTRGSKSVVFHIQAFTPI